VWAFGVVNYRQFMLIGNLTFGGLNLIAFDSKFGNKLAQASGIATAIIF